MKPSADLRSTIDPDFQRFETGRRVIVLHREIAPFADMVVEQTRQIALTRATGSGNRASGFHLTLAGVPELFVRRARRGGMVSALFTDTYFGTHPRPLQELSVAIEAKRRGIAVADPMGAIVEWAGPAIYRGFFLTRAIPGMTLWEFLRTDDDVTVRMLVVQQVRDAIHTMHERGLFHADLNLHNLMVTQAADSFAVKILDLDKARLYPEALSASLRRANLARLMRSAHKLDPEGKYVDASARAILETI
jgi:hypothetical protein